MAHRSHFLRRVWQLASAIFLDNGMHGLIIYDDLSKKLLLIDKCLYCLEDLGVIY